LAPRSGSWLRAADYEPELWAQVRGAARRSNAP
jgi:hypothetical protein